MAAPDPSNPIRLTGIWLVGALMGSGRRALGLLTALVTLGVAAGEPARIETHDNLNPAGRLRDGVLTLDLYAGLGVWYPEGDSSRSWTIAAFGEEGRPLTVPSPLIRVPVGTTIQASVRNTMALPLRIDGFCDRRNARNAVCVDGRRHFPLHGEHDERRRAAVSAP